MEPTQNPGMAYYAFDASAQSHDTTNVTEFNPDPNILFQGLIQNLDFNADANSNTTFPGYGSHSVNELAVIYQGYFVAPAGTYTIQVYSRFHIYIWTGQNAYSNWTQLNPNASGYNNYISTPVTLAEDGDTIPTTIAWINCNEGTGDFGVFIYSGDPPQGGASGPSGFFNSPLEPSDQFTYNLAD